MLLPDKSKPLDPQHNVVFPHKMREAGMTANVISFSGAFSACEKVGQWAQAVALLHKMHEAGMTAKVSSLNASISACKKGVQREQSVALLSKMREAGMTAKVLSFIAVRERWAVLEARLICA